MAQVVVKIYGRDHTLACDDGQEQHLFELSQTVDERMRSLARQMGAAPESLLMLLSSLTLADEVGELKGQIKSLESHIIKLKRTLDDQGDGAGASSLQDEAVMDLIRQATTRIDRIAEKLAMR